MSVKLGPYRRGGWEVDVRVRLADGRGVRERRKAPVTSKSAALRWGQARERELITHGPPKPKKEVPTLAEFAPRFIEGYARANRLKPSGIASKESHLKLHLLPLLGEQPLDRISNEEVQRLKSVLHDRSPATVNNILSTLSKLLKVSVEWDVLEKLPCTIKLLRRMHREMRFHDFDDYESLVEAARSVGSREYLVVLLGGEAGLRCGEMMALEWTDVDTKRKLLWVGRSEWQGHVTEPKGGRPRRVPLTQRLAGALTRTKHLRGPRVLCVNDGRSLTQHDVQRHVRRAERQATLAHLGVHALRHTFCSHLAMRGAPARAIQELAGHADLMTTQRYMHLSPSATESAIRLLEGRHGVGDILETGQFSSEIKGG